jgi:Family of unknown function (DUF6516)
MPVIDFPEYTRVISEAIITLVATGQARLVNFQIDQRSNQRGFIAGVIAFADNSELHFREFVDTSLPELKTMYAYHYQDTSSGLIFRYDNALHRPPLAQREHKHTSTGIELGIKPSLTEVLNEIISLQ